MRDLVHDFANQHVWVVHMVHRLYVAEAMAIHENQEVDLGEETLAVATGVICFRCEIPFLLGEEPCQGQPPETALGESNG